MEQGWGDFRAWRGSMEDLGNEMEKPGMVVNTCSPNTWEGGLTQIPDQP